MSGEVVMHTAGLPISGGTYASLGPFPLLVPIEAEIRDVVSGEAVMHKVGMPALGRTFA